MTYLPIIFIAIVIAWFILRTFRLRGIPTIAPAAVREQLKQRNLYLLDVRTPRELTRGKMRGAVNIPLHELPSRLPELEPHRGKQFVVVCATGSRSLSGTRILTKHGFQAASMTGGMMAWRE